MSEMPDDTTADVLTQVAPGEGGPRPHLAACGFLVSGAVWLTVGTLWGLLAAFQQVAPDAMAGHAELLFGRARQVHVNVVLFGFLTSTLLGVGLYILPSLLRTRLFSEKLALVSLAIWDLMLVGGVVTLSAGLTQAREYAEFIWPLDVLVVIAFVTLLYNAVMTILNRREKSLYVSVWYVTGAILWTCCVYPLGNVMWHPSTGSLTGVVDAIWLWFYGHNVIGLLFTPLAVGAAYYAIPRIARAPLYSHTLSIIGFWTLALIYTHIGTHHLIQAPVPLWLKVVAGVDSFMMLIPVATVLINLWMTARGHWGGFLARADGRFVFAGTVWYGIVCIQGASHSLDFVQRVTHFTDWVIAHAHIAVFGFAGMIGMGTAYHILPAVTGRRVWSQGLANLQYWLMFIGLWIMFIVLTIGGLIQGAAWLNGEALYNTLREVIVFKALRVLSGVMIASGAWVWLYNLLMTLRKGEPVEP
jgi:cytochrome c oxidase cbb3-type subunit 1/cytochrome c oxidase cbb3-type subunit I/II